MPRIISGLALAVICATTISLQAQTQGQKPVEYEKFCKLDAEAKRQAFQTMTPENRALVIKTQVERWLNANKARLNKDQAKFLADVIASITPDTYRDGPQGAEARKVAQALSQKLPTMFGIEDIQAMQPNGPCLSKGS